jgi:His/Glu/Gln/Arg/opine family amino acid ABC transporter permease subunit
MDYFDFLSRFLPLLLQGALMTVQILCVAAALSFICGLGFGILCCERLRVRGLSDLIEGITFVYRAVPFFVQLLIIYFVLPDLLGFNLESYPATVVALGMCSSGYVAQTVRAGINSIPVSQWEAAYTLGYTRAQTLWYVILPQMLRNVLPAFNNELDALLKSTAIASSIGLLELTRVGMNIVSREMEPVPTYLTIACFYLIMSALLNVITRTIERKITYVRS